jgi:hypothetical protein
MLVGGLGHTWACLTFFVAKGNMYKGRCAHCGVARGHKNFKNRQQGCPIPVDFCLGSGTADHLMFQRLDPKNDRLCSKCDRKGRDEAVEANKCSLDLLLICVNILHLERGCIFVLLCSLAVICHRHSGGTHLLCLPIFHYFCRVIFGWFCFLSISAKMSSKRSDVLSSGVA